MKRNLLDADHAEYAINQEVLNRHLHSIAPYQAKFTGDGMGAGNPYRFSGDGGEEQPSMYSDNIYDV